MFYYCLSKCYIVKSCNNDEGNRYREITHVRPLGVIVVYTDVMCQLKKL